MDQRFAQILHRNVASLRQLRDDHPQSLVLPVTPTTELEARLVDLLKSGQVLHANRVFWFDQLVTFDAWRSIALWRSSELIESALTLRERNSLVGCAALSRSAFELAISSLVVSGRLCQVLNKIDTDLLTQAFCGSRSFPADVELAIFGTRVQDAESVGLPSQKSVLTYISQLEKLSPDVDIRKNYDLLCDVTHPSWLGNRPFYRRSDQGTIARASREYDPSWQAEVDALSTTVLSWSAQATVNVMLQSHGAIDRLRTALKAA